MALSQTARGILIMVLAVFLFAAMDALVKRTIAEYGTVQAIWARYTGQTAIVALILAPRLRTVLRTRHPGGHLARSLCQFGASAAFFAGLGHVGLAEATAIMDVNPVLIALGAALFLGERLGPWRLFGVVAALAGALIVIRPGTGVFTPGALLPLAAAVFYAAYALLTRAVGRDEPVWTALVYTTLAGTLISTVMLPWHWTPVASAGDGLALLAIGALGAAAQFCLIRAFTLAEASVVAPFGYVGLIFAIGWGFALFGEVPDGATLAGGAIIVSAGLLVGYRETRISAALRRR